MIKKLVQALVATAVLFSISTGLILAQETVPPPVTDQTIADSVCQGVLGTQDQDINTTTTAADCKENGSETLNGVLKRIINIFSIVVGAVSVIMIIIGGFRYIISGGDSAGVSGAKNTILYALVGLVIVLFAQLIVKFVVSNVTPSTTTPAPATSSSQQQQTK